MCVRVCVCVCVCVRVCVCISFHRKDLLTEQDNKCNARNTVSHGMLRKYFCVKNLCCQIKDSHSSDLQVSNCAKYCQLNRAEPREVKENFTNFLETNSKKGKHSYLPPH